jgi:hypothetical protein
MKSMSSENVGSKSSTNALFFARSSSVNLAYELHGRGPQKVLLVMGFTVDRHGWSHQV